MTDYTELVKRLRTFEHSIAHPDMWDKMNAADAIEEQAAEIARLSAGLQLATEAFRDRIRDVRSENARLASLLEAQAATYEIGYSAGESSQLADWEVALDGLLPEGVGCRPLEVAAWIARLLAERDEDGGALGA